MVEMGINERVDRFSIYFLLFLERFLWGRANSSTASRGCYVRAAVEIRWHNELVVIAGQCSGGDLISAVACLMVEFQPEST